MSDLTAPAGNPDDPDALSSVQASLTVNTMRSGHMYADSAYKPHHTLLDVDVRIPG